MNERVNSVGDGNNIFNACTFILDADSDVCWAWTCPYLHGPSALRTRYSDGSKTVCRVCMSAPGFCVDSHGYYGFDKHELLLMRFKVKREKKDVGEDK